MCAIKITIIINYLCYHSLDQMHAMFRCDEICEMIFTCHKQLKSHVKDNLMLEALSRLRILHSIFFQ